VFVAVEASATSEGFSWAGNAVDINGDGLAMALPPEVEEGTDVLLTFTLDGTEFARLPAAVVRQDREFGGGALEFGEWPEEARLALLGFLLEASPPPGSPRAGGSRDEG
jgi:hypothetical protein